MAFEKFPYIPVKSYKMVKNGNYIKKIYENYRVFKDFRDYFWNNFVNFVLKENFVLDK